MGRKEVRRGRWVRFSVVDGVKGGACIGVDIDAFVAEDPLILDELGGITIASSGCLSHYF